MRRRRGIYPIVFNAKIKAFRGLVRGMTDRKFFLYRIAMIYG